MMKKNSDIFMGRSMDSGAFDIVNFLEFIHSLRLTISFVQGCFCVLDHCSRFPRMEHFPHSTTNGRV